MSGPLRLQLQPSRRLAAALYTAHGVAALALWLSPLPVVLSIAAGVALAMSAASSVRRHAFRSAASSLVELELYEDCTLSARSVDGRWLQYHLIGSSFVSRVLTVESAHRGRREEALGLIAADGIEAEAFRRLRVWLQWRCASTTAAPDGGAK
jgi:toxin CptA